MKDNFHPPSSDQMIRNLSMKIGEVDSGSARLLAAHSNLALLVKDSIPITNTVDLLLLDRLLVELIAV